MTGAHLRIESLGENVQGVRLFGDKNLPEHAEFRVMFPGGSVSAVRCSDGSYWAHVDLTRGDSGEPTHALVQARLDVDGKENSALGDLADPHVAHLAIRVAPKRFVSESPVCWNCFSELVAAQARSCVHCGKRGLCRTCAIDPTLHGCVEYKDEK